MRTGSRVRAGNPFELSTRELIAVIAADLEGLTAAQFRELAQKLGITKEELWDLGFPTAPSAEHTSEFLADVAAYRGDEGKLWEFRKQVERWKFAARDMGDIEAERRMDGLMHAIVARVRELRATAEGEG